MSDNEEAKPNQINISARENQQENGMHFKIKMSTKLGKVFTRFNDHKGVGSKAYRFMYDGDKVDEASTPQDLGMEDGDFIDAFIEAVGGK